MTQSGSKASAFAAIKYLLLAVFIGLLVRQYSGGKVSQTSFSDMQQAVLAVTDVEPMSLGDNQMIRRLYQLDPEQYEGVLLYYPTSNMGVEELFLVKLSDVSQAQTVEDAISRRVASQISSFEGYGPSQVEMLKQSITDVSGNYVLLIVAENPETVRQAFENAL